MLYRSLAEVYGSIESTSSRLEVTAALARLLRSAPAPVIARIVYLMQGKLRPDWEAVELGLGEKLAARAVADAVKTSLVAVARESRRQGDLGSAAETLMQHPAVRPPLSVEEVYAAFDRIARLGGEGSQSRKVDLLRDLLGRASSLEARYLVRTVTGRLRIGVGDATILEGLVRAFGARREEVERAYNLTADLAAAATALAEHGPLALRRVRATVNSPIRPMLAERLYGVEEILARLGTRCLAEYKYDGERLQIHRRGDHVELISRRLERVTEQYPDVIDAVRRSLRGRELIVEGEVVAVDRTTGRLLPFQRLMPRRRKHGVAEAVKLIPTVLFLFDALLVDGKDLTASPLRVRRAFLERLLVSSDGIRLTTSRRATSPRTLEAFFHEALRAGCEGLVCKDSEGRYQAGARGWLWIKLKREYREELKEPLDLVVVGAFNGKGRRAGTYGALLLASYDERQDVFRTVCKCGTGFSDQELADLPRRMRRHERSRPDPRVESRLKADVWFDPKVVLEVVGGELTISPTHTAGRDELPDGGGLALRFPRFTGRWRPDKGPQEATTETEIVQMFRRAIESRPEPSRRHTT
ncbi:MAG TPA: ATP-dependent DNA ligase [Myxococcaceae bacterium]|nr:ATP-dependent DNA ligase [Myxococcaceae bacterium]